MTEPALTANPSGINGRLAVLAVAPVVLLALFLVFVRNTGVGLQPSGAPPLEDLTVQRVLLPRPGEMVVQVMNGGPSPVTVAQVAVDDAFWDFAITPQATVPRLSSATVTIPYPWVEGEPHEVKLVSSTGLTFSGAVDVSLAQPASDFATLLRFLLLGLYVGIVPVALGMLWYPVVKALSPTWLTFVLSLTVGLLVFLFLDTILEAQELATRLPAGLHGAPLVWLLVLLTAGAIEALGSIRRTGRSPLGIAALVALGIGLHNLGEGVAIGAAYTSGELALGVFLIVGFTLHNLTEGLAIATPLSRGAPRLVDFAVLVLVAGAPAMLGTWLGAFVHSDLAATVFFAVGAGAIAQVVYTVSKYTARVAATENRPALTPASFGGFVTGVAIMYGTALLVAA